MASRHELADRAAGVVPDQRHVLEVQRRHEVGQDPGDAGWGEVRIRAHRLPM
jgi:hypothetical protein